MKTMMTDQNYQYQSKVERLVQTLFMKYMQRKDIYEPLSKILPYYWNDIFLSAVKRVMFKRVNVLSSIHNAPKKYVWTFIKSGRTNAQIATEIIEVNRNLKNMIYNKNKWGNPGYIKPVKPTVMMPKALEYKYMCSDGNIHIVSLMDFKRRYTYILREAGVPNNVNDELVETIYKTITDSYDTGHDQGVISSKSTRRVFNADKIIDVYENIELAALDLKKIIDES